MRIPLIRSFSQQFDLAIDLGTSNIIVSGPKGNFINEASLVAAKILPSGQKEIVKVGQEAKALEGKAPADVEVLRPLKKGVIAEFEMAAALMKSLLQKIKPNSSWLSPAPRLLLTLPRDVTNVEKRAFQEAALRAGAREVKLMPEPTAAAIGLGLDIFSSTGEMIVDIGAGTTEVALFSLGGIVHSHSIRIGGNDMDQAIQQYFRQRYNFAIGAQTAESLKLRSLAQGSPPDSLRAAGLDLFRGLPASMSVHRDEVIEAISPVIDKIVRAVLIGLEHSPEELAADLIDQGIRLTGGGALISLISERLNQETQLRFIAGKNPLLEVAQGEQILLRDRKLANQLYEIE